MASSSSSDDLCARWTDLADDVLSVEDIRATLAPIEDDLWVAAACQDRLLDDADAQRSLLDEGIKRSESAAERIRNLCAETDSAVVEETLTSYFKDEPADAQLCHIRATLFARLDRLNAYVEACQSRVQSGTREEGMSADPDADWEDDPWAEDGDEAAEAGPSSKATTLDSLPISLSRFLSEDLLSLACFAAASASYEIIRILLKRYADELWPYRFTILDSIPEHVQPLDYRDLLPAFDINDEREELFEGSPARSERDIVELPHVLSSLVASGAIPVAGEHGPSSRPSACPKPLSSADLFAWYSTRVDRILETTGMADIALAFVQHGASQGVQGLDELGEELSLMARLAYVSDAISDKDDLSLDRWRAMDPDAVVKAYLSQSRPETVVSDIRKLVMPYLFVLEARAERAGHPDPKLITRLLHNYLLSAPLNVLASVFDASKPTLPVSQRLLRDDEEMARLALACLYGSDSLNEWSTMSRIFECLPAWDLSAEEDLTDEGDTTLVSLGAFVVPSTQHPRVSPADLLMFFQPLPASSLSHILDILDVHFESGEILARWNVPAPLRWFLQSMQDEGQQRSRATRMARRHGGSEDNLDSLEEWEWLLEDMLKLTEANEAGVRSAFGRLAREEVIRIYFSGLLSTGKFDIARTLLGSKKHPLGLDDQSIEDICLAASREFYDNASSGNYHFGEMKLAYDCLSVPPLSDRTQQEKDFIEATSRISSFQVMSRPGMPITPLEIRLTKDRLSLVARVLGSTSDAYKYPEVILDLVAKLNLSSDPAAQVKALAMIADTAMQSEDFTRAHDTSELMVSSVLALESQGATESEIAAAREVCWIACFQLGRQPMFEDAGKKRALLARALEFCPPAQIGDVLAAWRRLEAEEPVVRQPRRRRGAAGRANRRTAATAQGTVPSLAARIRGLGEALPIPNSPDAAALAHTFSRVAANFPFSSRLGSSIGRPSSVASLASDDSSATRGRSGSQERHGWTRGEDVQAQASKAFQKGIGWLIGADEE
ncbi:unnamed protein product [Peniophora sp. CBMAI 1063]|nr:unnamed protein product [Peniophora sp. CBMAI 1063]